MIKNKLRKLGYPKNSGSYQDYNFAKKDMVKQFPEESYEEICKQVADYFKV